MTKTILMENVETAPLEDLLEAQKVIGLAIRVKQEAVQAEQLEEQGVNRKDLLIPPDSLS